MKRIRLLGISASLVLLAGSAGAQTAFFTNGVVRHQFWSDTNPNGVSSPTRLQVENGQAGNPTFDDFSTPTLAAIAARTAAPTAADFNLTVFDTPEEEGDNYVDRVSTLFIPPTTGKYVFFLASDDDSDLFISTDATPANKKMIASQASWSNMDAWGAGQLRSDQWTNAAGQKPWSNGIPLVAGQKYWLEAIHHEGGGGDQVGATYKLIGDPDPASGTASALTAAVIGYGLTFSSPITVAKQVTNTTAYAGTEASFTFVPNNPSSDTLVNDSLTYQWFRNGTAVNGATGQSYTFVAGAGDNAAQYTCVATLDPIFNISLSVTSSVATLTVNSGSVTYTNGLKVEQFLGSNRQGVENNSTGPANSITVSVNGAETVVNDGINNYGRRMSGWYIPPTSGNYVFFISSDDDADLFLSTDSTPANKTLIAQETNWGASREWADAGTTNTSGMDAGGTLLSQKRSDQWTNDVGVAPFTNGIALLAGHTYYIEADSHQGGGGDDLGVLAQLVGAPDPTNGAPPIPANQLSLVTSPTTTLTISTQPHDTTVFEGGVPIFTGAAKSDSEFSVLYQWQREGTNIPGATAASYSFTTTVADNNTHFALVASTAEGGLSITSSVAKLTVQTAVFEQGLALMQYWLNKGADLTVPESGAFGPPDFVMAVPAFEAGINNENGNTYVNEISGFFVPAASGPYDFIVTGDDHLDLFLSTDSNPNNKRMIAQQPGWSNALTWNTDNGGGSDLQQKNSATWSNAVTGTVPFANGIQLVQGQKYYIEVWHQESGGGDSVGVTYVQHGQPIQPDGTDSLIAGTQLGFNAPNTATYVEFTNQPVSTSALSGTKATFTAGGVSDGNVVIGTTGIFNTSGDVAGVGDFVKFPNVLFQWYKNGTLIPGATTSTYTTPSLKPADSAQYYVGIRALGMATWSNSVTASLTVIADTNKPNVFAAEFDQNLIPIVTVTFDKTMDLASISDITHYNLTGATIASILVNSNDARHVQLQLVGEPTSLPLSLTLSGITDFSGNVPAVSTLSVPSAGLTNSDIGSSTDPAFPGFMWADNTNAYTIKCEGSDIWGTDDGFNFSYESKTGDFDVVVRQMTFTKTSQWAKGGLMVREDLTSGSRNWNIVNDPSNADGTEAQDGNGTGQNQIECNARFTTSTASVGWDNITRPAPTYPNAWVRLKRVGQTLTAYSGSNGQTWVQNAYTDWSTNAPAMPNTVFVGICGTAHNNDALTADPPLHYYTASFANYNSSYVATTPPNQATVSASISGANIVISWTPAGGTLQSSTTLGAGAVWSTVGTANPATIPLSGAGAKFFRVGP